MSLVLPDCSEFQVGASAPDWAGIKAKNGGAGIIRVGYGNAKLDGMFVHNYATMKANKFRFIGLYQYLRASQDAASQATAFCNWIGPPSAVYPGTVFILDLEEGTGDQSGRALAWHNIVDAHYGLDKKNLNLRSWLYSYTSFVTGHNLGAIFASNRHTWIAAYSGTEPAIGHTLWQSTDGVTGSHITDWPGCGKCDTSYYGGSLDSLASTGWALPPVDPPAFHGEWVSAGMLSLTALAATFHLFPASLLRMTAVHYGSFDPLLAVYVNDVMSEKIPATTPLPKGAKVWVN